MTAQAQQMQPMAGAQVLEIDLIQDGGAQMRVEMSDQTIADYAEEMAGGVVFPAVVVYHDGTAHWLADGFHRVEAARALGRETIAAEVREGSERDAIRHGIGANARHGLRRTQADKRRAVETLLRDPEWSKLSDRKLAKVAKVSDKTVAKVRSEVLGAEFRTPMAPFHKPNGPDGGEFPTPMAPAPTSRPSLVLDLLRSIANDALVEECQRRGLTVEAK